MQKNSLESPWFNSKNYKLEIISIISLKLKFKIVKSSETINDMKKKPFKINILSCPLQKSLKTNANNRNNSFKPNNNSNTTIEIMSC